MGEHDTSDLWVGRAIADRGPRLLVRFEHHGERLVRVRDELPVVGDWVLAEPGDEPRVVRIVERRSWLSRNAAGGRTEEQVLAANVDVVFIVQGLDQGVNLRRIERTLAAVHAGGAVPVVVLTKADLGHAPGPVPGVEVIVASGVTGEGVDQLSRRLGIGTGVFVGPSGAGKSTLVNALLGDDVQATGEVRVDDARGRHTTTGRVLLTLPSGGMIIDGPGIRELRLWDGAGLEAAFADVAEVASRCRFGDCRHDGEPGCAVAAAVEAGAIDGERLESFTKLSREAAWQATQRDGAAARAQKQKVKVMHREARRFRRERGR